jgi:hypothetical protein
MKLSAPVSSIFLLQPCRAYRHDLDDRPPHPRCWFEPTPAIDQRVPHTRGNRALNPLPEESGNPRKEGAQSKRVRIIGQAALVVPEDNRNQTRGHRLCHVGLNQHIKRLSHLAMPVSAELNRADVHRPLASGKCRAASRPMPKRFFCAEGASARNPGPTPFPDESGKGFISSVYRPPKAIGIQAMQPERPLEPRNTCDHRFRPARVRSATSPGMLQTTSLRPLKPEPATAIASSPSLFVKPRINLRHQDRPKRKFPDLRFPGQPAQVAPS